MSRVKLEKHWGKSSCGLFIQMKPAVVYTAGAFTGSATLNDLAPNGSVRLLLSDYFPAGSYEEASLVVLAVKPGADQLLPNYTLAGTAYVSGKDSAQNIVNPTLCKYHSA